MTHFTFSGNGSAFFTNDPWTEGGKQAQVNIVFRGSSGRQFPHVSSEITCYLTTPDPASIVRTLTKQALGLNYSNPTCGTTAGQDLVFVNDEIRVILSTWDSMDTGRIIPSRDARSYSCVTTKGNVASGTPCHFPFEYNGQLFDQCTMHNWHTPWCSTTSVYSGQWGQCVCETLRRGVQMTGQVRLNETGPLLTLNANGVHEMIQPIADGKDLQGVNASLKFFFPIFDSESSNDLEMLVLLVRRAAEGCDVGNQSSTGKVPTIDTAPSGECERLGYITQWMGEPGDESMVVCKDVEDVFPSGTSAEFVAAASQAMQRSQQEDAYISSSSPVDESQACVDVGFARELSLCTAEKFRHIPVAAPELFGRQFCFWTDTSRNPGLEPNKFAECAVCYGSSCTSNHEPLRAWQLQDRQCFRFPCV